MAFAAARCGPTPIVASRKVRHLCGDRQADRGQKPAGPQCHYAVHVGRWDELPTASSRRCTTGSASLGVLVNNAGMSPTYETHPTSAKLSVFDSVVNLNLRAFRLSLWWVSGWWPAAAA